VQCSILPELLTERAMLDSAICNAGGVSELQPALAFLGVFCDSVFMFCGIMHIFIRIYHRKQFNINKAIQ